MLYDVIYLCILVEKYDQSKLGQNCTFSNVSSIAGRAVYRGGEYRENQDTFHSIFMLNYC